MNLNRIELHLLNPKIKFNFRFELISEEGFQLSDVGYVVLKRVLEKF